MVSLGSLKISFLFVATVLIFFTAGLLSLAPRARRSLGEYRIPWRPAFSSHLRNPCWSEDRGQDHAFRHGNGGRFRWRRANANESRRRSLSYRILNNRSLR